MAYHFKPRKVTHSGKERDDLNDVTVRAKQSARIRGIPITLAGPNGTTISVIPKSKPKRGPK